MNNILISKSTIIINQLSNSNTNIILLLKIQR